MGVRTYRHRKPSKKLRKKFQALDGKTIQVGIFGDDGAEMLKIARANEFGVTIRPKNGKYLAIPSKQAGDRRPRDYGDTLRFVATRNGNGLLVKDVAGSGAANRGARSEIIFFLMKSVTIPERSFIRAGFDENIDGIQRKIEQMMPLVLQGLAVDRFLEAIALEFEGKIKLKLRDVSAPPNAAITRERKGSSNPLIDTGRLVGAIRHEVK